MAERAKPKQVEVPMALVTNVGQAASGIVSSILLLATGASLDSLKPELTGYLGQKIGIARALRVGAISDVYSTIETELEFDYKFMIDALKAGLGQGVGGLLSSLYGLLAGTDALTSGYQGLIQRIGIDPYISRWVNSQIKPNIPDAETAWYMSRLGIISWKDWKVYGEQNGWDDGWLNALHAAWLSPAPIGMILDLVRRGQLSGVGLSDQLKRYRLSDGMIDLVTSLSVQYPEPYRLAEMHTKGLTTNDEYYGATRIFGLEDKWAGYWAEGQLRYPDFSTALALLRRGEIDEGTFYFWMQRSQISPSETEVMLKLKDVIPPISDLIRFAVREAFLDHDPEKQYSEMAKHAAKMGLTSEASEWYWYSHWDRIPVNLMYANYHRGLWTVEKLERMLKIVDVHPDDRQDIINVAYGVPSIREMGYGFDVGVYTTEDIKRFRRWGGLSPADADKAAESMVAYRTEAERNSVRTELMYAYGFDRIDRDTLRTRLTEIRTPEAAIELWMTRADLYRERIKKPAMDVEGRIVSSSEALAAFKLKIRDEAWTRERLKALDWTVDRIDVAVERAKLDMAETAAKEAEVKERKLTVAQIRTFYTLHLISKEEMTVELVKIGYGAEDAEVLTGVYTAEPEVIAVPKPFSSGVAANMYKLAMFDEDDLTENFKLQDYSQGDAEFLTVYTVLSQEFPYLRALYEKGVISSQEMVNELMKLEVPEYNAWMLVKRTVRELQIERLTIEKDLTKAEIIKGVKNMMLTPTQGASLLVDLGYDQDEAYYILAINKVVAAGDPEGYWEMRKVTEAYKKAKGEKYVDIPDEAIMLEKQIKVIKAQIDELKKTGGNEQAIADLLQKLNTLELAMKTLVTEKKLK